MMNAKSSSIFHYQSNRCCESEARSMGCDHPHLTTLDYQTRIIRQTVSEILGKREHPLPDRNSRKDTIDQVGGLAFAAAQADLPRVWFNKSYTLNSIFCATIGPVGPVGPATYFDDRL